MSFFFLIFFGILIVCCQAFCVPNAVLSEPAEKHCSPPKRFLWLNFLRMIAPILLPFWPPSPLSFLRCRIFHQRSLIIYYRGHDFFGRQVREVGNIETYLQQLISVVFVCNVKNRNSAPQRKRANAARKWSKMRIPALVSRQMIYFVLYPQPSTNLVNALVYPVYNHIEISVIEKVSNPLKLSLGIRSQKLNIAF